MANCMPIYNPVVPFQGAILGGICEGKRVTIQGQVHSHAKSFAVNFVCFNNDIAFHFNPRFEDGSVIVCNTMQSNNWGSEERKNHMPFNKNAYFEVVIVVLGHAFQVTVNGQHLLEYRHRVSYQSIQSLQVNGDVILTAINFSGLPAQTLPEPPPYSVTPSYMPNACMPPAFSFTERKSPVSTSTFQMLNLNMSPAFMATKTCAGPVTVHNPIMPFQAAFHGKFTKNRNIVLVGTVSCGADRFHVNLLNSNSRNIYLHINPRFKEGAVVRNTQNRGVWGPEERQMSYLPFAPGQQFQMEIRNEGGWFGVYVNGAKVFTYVHRLPANQIDLIEVAGDVSLSYVQY
ncbi:hypothetical protein GDO86_015543 [Hymenochirus boettgeri]|uniref:Galectin n=1 Tax=Hymenochirus boettgeri TaxID=247094 RepID=A0A8T2JYP8_9PIPI|nr:hypothetical protein GDO86_015543 [Hymenochirus boettgeri]